jgi:hypothetical protein
MTLRSIPIDVPSLLARIYVPLQPLVRRIRLVRRGRRSYEPRDILLPSGYVAEVVCDGLTAPVHAAFGPRGEMYVTESGHKSESPPRIYRVDPDTGDKRLVVELGGERWVPSARCQDCSDHGDPDDAREQPVELLDGGMTRRDVDEFGARTVGPVVAAQAAVGEPHCGAGHDDRCQRRQGSHGDRPVALRSDHRVRSAAGMCSRFDSEVRLKV